MCYHRGQENWYHLTRLAVINVFMNANTVTFLLIWNKIISWLAKYKMLWLFFHSSVNTYFNNNNYLFIYKLILVKNNVCEEFGYHVMPSRKEFEILFIPEWLLCRVHHSTKNPDCFVIYVVLFLFLNKKVRILFINILFIIQ